MRSALYYHKPTDSLDTLHYIDLGYTAGITRATVGYLASQAGLLPERDAHLAPAGIANAASWVSGPIAASELVSLTGTGLAGTGGETTVTVRDSGGTELAASLTWVSPRQINLLLPDLLAPGPSTITVARADGIRLSARTTVEALNPGIFTANSNGWGPAAAQAVRVTPDGTQTLQELYTCSVSLCVSVPVEFGSQEDRVFLILYGTGIRGRSDQSNVALQIERDRLAVDYAGAQPTYAGLDQVNAELPRSLRGRGEIAVTLWVDGRAANPVLVNLGTQ